VGLLETAAADLAGILSDDVGGFAVPITLVDPSGNQATINGLANDIGFTINPETGVAVSGQKATVALPIRALTGAGLGQPQGVASAKSRPWTVTFTLSTGVEQTFKVASTMPDALGCLVCHLETYEQ
jgi:hypothetical protein